MRTSPGSARVRMTGPQRHAQLIDVARGLFALRGFDGATIEEIAAAAGVSKPVVYEHFGSKEVLYSEVVTAEFDRLLEAVTTALSADAGPRVLLERAAFTLLDYIEEHTDGFRILTRDSPLSQPEGTFSTLLSRIATDVEHILSTEFANRSLDPGVGGMYAQMLVGMVAMTGQWWLDARTPDKATVAAHLVNLAWNGLTGLQKEPRLGSVSGGVPGSGGAPAVLTLSAVLVHDGAGRVLLVRKRGTSRFMQPGGKLEPGETFAAAAVREMAEELGVRVAESDLEDLGRWYGPAANEDNTFIDAGLFGWTLPAAAGPEGRPAAAAEIEEILWIEPAAALERSDLSPLLRDHLLPQLVSRA